MVKCKFCNGMGQIEIGKYRQGNPENPDFQLAEVVYIHTLRIDCPKCNRVG